MVTSTPTATAHGVAHSGMFHVMTHARFLAARTIRESLRQPGVEVTNIFIPLFFLAVSTAAIGGVAGRAFGVDNYLGFQLPVAVLQAVAGSSSASGIAIVTDMERGYFDKLLLTPASRWSLIIGRVSADAVRAVFFSAVMLVAALIFGAGMHAGVGGVVVVLLMAAGVRRGLLRNRHLRGDAHGQRAGRAGQFPALLPAPLHGPGLPRPKRSSPPGCRQSPPSIPSPT